MTDDVREAMVAVALEHAAAEARCDLDATMATLGDNPVYELQPMGVVLCGRDFARHYYERFFAECLPRVTDYGLRSEWIGDGGVLQEYTLSFRNSEGDSTAHNIIGVLVFGTDGKLAGERIWAGPELMQFMFGPFLGEAAPA